MVFSRSEKLWREYNLLISKLIEKRGEIEKIVLEIDSNLTEFDERNLALRQIQKSFHIGNITNKLIQDGFIITESQERAKRIVNSPGFKSSWPESEKRSEYDESLYVNSRKLWSDTLHRLGVRAIG